MITVRNINGTSDTACVCGSWINHWENFSGQKAHNCSAIGCGQRYDLVGAHVQKSLVDRKWYIIPLCQAHNMSSGNLEVFNSTVFVSANKSETCE